MIKKLSSIKIATVTYNKVATVATLTAVIRLIDIEKYIVDDYYSDRKHISFSQIGKDLYELTVNDKVVCKKDDKCDEKLGIMLAQSKVKITAYKTVKDILVKEFEILNHYLYGVNRSLDSAETPMKGSLLDNINRFSHLEEYERDHYANLLNMIQQCH